MMTGVGIFIFPNVVLQHIGSSGASLVIWTIAGVVTILAGLCYSELALSLPVSYRSSGTPGVFNTTVLAADRQVT